jgi:hypothetical protein
VLTEEEHGNLPDVLGALGKDGTRSCLRSNTASSFGWNPPAVVSGADVRHETHVGLG